jgi:hypothetical protein
MTGTTKEQLERVEQSEQRRLADEEQRHGDMLAKTASLREQRLARDAAEAETAKKAKPNRRA